MPVLLRALQLCSTVCATGRWLVVQAVHLPTVCHTFEGTLHSSAVVLGVGCLWYGTVSVDGCCQVSPGVLQAVGYRCCQVSPGLQMQHSG